MNLGSLRMKEDKISGLYQAELRRTKLDSLYRLCLGLERIIGFPHHCSSFLMKYKKL